MYNLILLPVLAAYFAAFMVQEKLFKETFTVLQPIPSFQLLQATTGYFHQVTAEILFIKAAVFLGGVKPGVDPLSYAPVLAHNYRQITSLYPEFIDPYYYAQAYLPYVGNEYARAANDILATGITTYPQDFFLHLFMGTNYFVCLDEPLAAAAVFQTASNIPNAPPMFGHLAAILSAQGGNLQAGLITLQIILKTEKNETVRERYLTEIEMFQKALEVQNAVLKFRNEKGNYPKTLDELAPKYLAEIPKFGTMFELVWEQPQIKLKRPDPKNASPVPPQ